MTSKIEELKDLADRLFCNLADACKKGNVKRLKEALKIFDNKELARKLEACNVSINMQQSEYLSLTKDDDKYVRDVSLPMLAAFNGHSEVLKELRPYNADFNLKDGKGNTALIHAAEQNHLKAVEVLTESSVDLNCKNEDGHSALLKAVFNKNSFIVDVLLSKGADHTITDSTGDTALIKAIGIFDRNKDYPTIDVINKHCKIEPTDEELDLLKTLPEKLRWNLTV